MTSLEIVFCLLTPLPFFECIGGFIFFICKPVCCCCFTDQAPRSSLTVPLALSPQSFEILGLVDPPDLLERPDLLKRPDLLERPDDATHCVYTSQCVTEAVQSSQ